MYLWWFRGFKLFCVFLRQNILNDCLYIYKTDISISGGAFCFKELTSELRKGCKKAFLRVVYSLKYISFFKNESWHFLKGKLWISMQLGMKLFNDYSTFSRSLKIVSWYEASLLEGILLWMHNRIQWIWLLASLKSSYLTEFWLPRAKLNHLIKMPVLNPPSLTWNLISHDLVEKKTLRCLNTTKSRMRYF